MILSKVSFSRLWHCTFCCSLCFGTVVFGKLYLAACRDDLPSRNQCAFLPLQWCWWYMRRYQQFSYGNQSHLPVSSIIFTDPWYFRLKILSTVALVGILKESTNLQPPMIDRLVSGSIPRAFTSDFHVLSPKLHTPPIWCPAKLQTRGCVR